MEEIVHNRVTLDGMREIKVVSDVALTEQRMLRFFSGPCREYAKVNCYNTAALALFFGEISFPLRGALDVTCEFWEKPRRFAVWRLMKEDGMPISHVTDFIARWYFMQTHRRPAYAFMKSLPGGIENGYELDDVMFMQADWALEKCVMVGG